MFLTLMKALVYVNSMGLTYEFISYELIKFYRLLLYQRKHKTIVVCRVITDKGKIQGAYYNDAETPGMPVSCMPTMTNKLVLDHAARVY